MRQPFVRIVLAVVLIPSLHQIGWTQVGIGVDYSHIFRIESTRGPGLEPGQVRVQTGFRLEGQSGIITALHGVVGCRRIDAYYGQTGLIVFDLEIVEADIERDVALLLPRRTKRSDNNLGLRKGDELGSQNGLTVVGFPRGTRAPFPSHVIGIRFVETPYTKFGNLDPDTIIAIDKRGSPDRNARMLSIQVPAQRGHSGAPIINDKGEVVGIVLGGLPSSQIILAVPMWDVKLTPVEQRKRDFGKLRGLETKGLFAEAIHDNGLEFLKVLGVDGGSNLNKITSVAATLDGKYIYAASVDNNAIFAFRWDRFIEDMEVVRLEEGGIIPEVGGIAALLVSPDGRHLYAKGSRKDVMVVFKIDEVSGKLGFCRAFHYPSLSGPISAEMSPNGKYFYVASSPQRSVSLFNRDMVTGEFSFVEDYPLEQESDRPTEGSLSLALALDDSNVYVLDRGRDELLVYHRISDGKLSLIRTYEKTELDLPYGLTSIAVHRSQEMGFRTGFRARHSLYVTTEEDCAIALLDVELGGNMKLRQIHRNCVPTVSTSYRPISVLATPDGTNVLVGYAHEAQGGLAIFDCDPETGELFHPRIAEGISAVGKPAVADFSFKGEHVYMGSSNPGNISVLRLRSPDRHIVLARSSHSRYKRYKDLEITYKGIVPKYIGQVYIISLCLEGTDTCAELQVSEQNPLVRDETIGVYLQLTESFREGKALRLKFGGL